jgi:hypothetical protein
MINFSVDIETLSVEDSAVVLSIAVVAWSDDLELLDPYIASANFNLYPIYQIKDGRTMTKSALGFWQGQDYNVWEAATMDAFIDYKQGLLSFVDFIKKCGASSNSTFWARGNMDEKVLNHILAQSGISTPWSFRQWRDARTFCDELDRFIGLPIPDVSPVAHVAMNDAMNMTYKIVEIMKELKGKFQ